MGWVTAWTKRFTQIAQDGSFFSRVYTETRRYLSYVFNTWRGLAYIATVGGVSLFDLGTMVAYALIGTIVLGFVLVLCLFATSEPVTNWYWNNAKKSVPPILQLLNGSDLGWLITCLCWDHQDWKQEQLHQCFQSPTLPDPHYGAIQRCH